MSLPGMSWLGYDTFEKGKRMARTTGRGEFGPHKAVYEPGTPRFADPNSTGRVPKLGSFAKSAEMGPLTAAIYRQKRAASAKRKGGSGNKSPYGTGG